LMMQEKIYRCGCSRKNVSPIYAQTCRNQNLSAENPHSLRLKTDSRQIMFNDDLQGKISQNLADYGDFILKRKDNIIAYQFAVVLDDMRQNVNHVVRGMDLLNETSKQIYLQHVLNLPTPTYCHVQILVDENGIKLSKTTLAAAVNTSRPNRVLFQLLELLKQKPPSELEHATVPEILEWAIQNWTVSNLKMMTSIYCGKF
jgi:glutamyl-Q tRNA(Asp) synthetase